MWATTIKGALHKFHKTDGQKSMIRLRVIEGPNVHDQIMIMIMIMYILYIPYICSGSPNKCWLHTCNACVITTWILGLGAPLVARNNCMYNTIKIHVKITLHKGQFNSPCSQNKLEACNFAVLSGIVAAYLTFRFPQV